MKNLEYRKKADVLYIRLTDNAIDHTEENSEDVLVDVDVNGDVVGIEILGIKARLAELESETVAEPVAV